MKGISIQSPIQCIYGNTVSGNVANILLTTCAPEKNAIIYLFFFTHVWAYFCPIKFSAVFLDLLEYKIDNRWNLSLLHYHISGDRSIETDRKNNASGSPTFSE